MSPLSVHHVSPWSSLVNAIPAFIEKLEIWLKVSSRRGKYSRNGHFGRHGTQCPIHVNNNGISTMMMIIIMHCCHYFALFPFFTFIICVKPDMYASRSIADLSNTIVSSLLCRQVTASFSLYENVTCFFYLGAYLSIAILM